MCKEQDCNSCNTRVAYEQAIKGYQFHVQRYQTWVNYYAIFVGALFVALYNIKPSMGNFCLCTPTSSLTWELLLSYLVVVLGWLASVCWLASITGHYNWMLSWTHIVKLRERRFFHGKEPGVFFVRLRPLFRRNENSAVLLRRPILFHNFPPFLFKKVHFLLENIRRLFQFISGFQPQIGGSQLPKGRNRRYDFFQKHKNPPFS